MKKILLYSVMALSLIVILAVVPVYKHVPGKFANISNNPKDNLLHQAEKSQNEDDQNDTPSDNLHLHHVNPDIPLRTIIAEKGLANNADFHIHVELSTRTLSFKCKDQTLKEYRISAGPKTDLGDKEKEGDYRTPRGEFYICSRAVYNPPKGYIGSRWMMLSYPGIEAADKGLKNSLITQDVYTTIKSANTSKKTPPQDTPLGSAIGIHGGARPNLSKDWTAGCVGMYDQDVEEIYEYAKVGTKVIIE